MTGPVTAQIQALFERHGLDPMKHEALIGALMRMTWDRVEAEIAAILDGGRSCARIGGGERHG